MAKSDSHSSSRLTATVLKAMGLFSGLQITSILCSIVKMKLVAIWLHATGVGLFGIYQTVTDTIATLTDLGLRQSSVRDIARQQSSPSLLASIAGVVRRWSALAGLLGAAVIMGASPLLSKWFFHTWQAPWGFMILAVAMMLNALTAGEHALLQGTSRLKQLARANLVGTIAGLAVSIPMFRLLGLQSVSLSIVAYALAMYLAARHQRLRVPASTLAPGLRDIWVQGRSFARLGVCLAIAAFVTNAAHTIFVALINASVGTGEVGYIQAGDTIIVRYIGLIFTAIGMEFYPRLAKVAHRPRATRTYVDHEATLLLVTITPLLLIFIMLRCTVVNILYTSDFLCIIPFITWGALSAIPKALSWCMAFSIICRGDGRVYILTETLDALISVPLCYFAYSSYGFTGLGVAYILWYIIYLLITGAVYYGRYKLSLRPSVIALSTSASLITVAAILAIDYLPEPLTYIAVSLVAVAFMLPLRRLLKR